MNYGLWKDKNITLYKANKNLCDFIYEKGKINNYDKFTILDVGCGYGTQDILWSKKISSASNLIAVDISKKQIKYANKKLKNLIKIKNKLTYMECDAHNLLDKFSNNKFNRIISLESAFHYYNRARFFMNVNNLLTNDGIFVISDIILKTNKNNMFKNIFIKIASDFLCIPEKNLITLDKWKNDIENSDLSIIEFYNITDKTFDSYYNYFFKNYIKNKKLPTVLSSILCHIFDKVQPFDYIVAVCKKSNNSVVI
jgi:erythromycin 3''-O-methyltransferase